MQVNELNNNLHIYYLINVRNLNPIMIVIYVGLGPTNVDANGHVIVENDVNLAYFEPLSLWPHPWPPNLALFMWLILILNLQQCEKECLNFY